MADNNNENHEHTPDSHSSPCRGQCTNKKVLEREVQMRAKGSLIDNMVYHIRTLSNAVIGFSDLLLGELDDEDLAGYVQEIYGAGQGLSVLASEVLDWTQLLSGDLVANRTKGPLSETLNELEQLLSWGAKEKQLDYKIIVDPEVPAYIHTDHNRLLKCLVNLTTSAIKHTASGTVRIHVKLDFFGEKPFVRFDVIDTGIGIEPEKLSKIFEPTVYRIEIDEEILAQLNRGLTVTTGLPLTLQLIELMGGTLEAKSKVGEGSTFTVRIPAGLDISKEIKLNPAPSDQSNSAQQQTSPAEPQTKRVLLVEDQESNRTVLTLMLEAIDVEAVAVPGGHEAIENVESNVYDLVLMDLRMPEIDGYETTRRLRDKGLTIPIIALSAKVIDDIEHHKISELFDGFLAKPVDQHKLAEIINRFPGRVKPAEVQSSGPAPSGDDVESFEYGS